MLDRPVHSKNPKGKDGAQSIRRAVAILRVLAAGREAGVPLAEVVQVTGLTRPTAHRIVHVLIEEGIVEKNTRSGRYAIGRQVPELALARQSRSSLLVAAEPHLIEVSKFVGDTLFLTVRTGFDTLCIARQIGAFPIQVLSLEVGTRRPLGVSSAGIAVLALMPEDEVREIVMQNEIRFETYRTTAAIAYKQIAATRQRGYCVRDIGLIPGTKAISAAISDAEGQAIAAITVSAVRNRLGPSRESEVADRLKAAAKAIETALG
jgi:DNA-binding IclR family transcriptional regulator